MAMAEVIIGIPVPVTLRDEIDKLAKCDERSRAQWCRIRLEKAVKKEKKERGQSDD